MCDDTGSTVMCRYAQEQFHMSGLHLVLSDGESAPVAYLQMNCFKYLHVVCLLPLSFSSLVDGPVFSHVYCQLTEMEHVII